MATTSTERVQRWQSRMRMKARLFDTADNRRREMLTGPSQLDETPEGRAVKAFFLAYPRCFTLPVSVIYGSAEARWSIYVYPGASEIEKAAAQTAMSEVSSMPIVVCSETDDAYQEWRDLPLAFVREEVAEMRALGLWSAE